jgi:outer membrane receptor protein involved in Fe transport
MLGDTGRYFTVPNGELGPEKSDTLELVARLRLWRMTASVSGFATFLDDFVKRVPCTWEGQAQVGGKDVVHNINGSSGLLLGTEAELRIDLGLGLSSTASLAYARGDEHVEGGPDVPLTRIPPLFGGARLRWDAPRWGSWQGFAETYARGALEQDRLSLIDKTDTRIPPGGTPGWWTLNAAVGATLDRWLRLGLRVENILDEGYKYHGSGIYAPGTNAILYVEGTI